VIRLPKEEFAQVSILALVARIWRQHRTALDTIPRNIVKSAAVPSEQPQLAVSHQVS